MKNGIVTRIVAGADATQLANVSAKVIPPSPPTGTLGEMARLALVGLTVTAIVVVDFGRRTVGVFAHSADVAEDISGYMDGTGDPTYTLTAVDASKSSPEWNFLSPADAPIGPVLAGGNPPANAFDTAVDLAVGFSRATKSISGLVGVVEDALETAALEGFMVIDQDAETVKITTVEDTSALVDVAAGGQGGDVIAALIATFQQIPNPDSGNGSGPFLL